MIKVNPIFAVNVNDFEIAGYGTTDHGDALRLWVAEHLSDGLLGCYL
jgi:hypothetical protein